MSGETSLQVLLAGMQPSLHAEPYVFCTVEPDQAAILAAHSLGLFREAEGVTLILPQAEAERLKLPYTGLWAWITLTIHSSLNAVGFIAAVSSRLATAGLSVNPVAGYYHDHLFVPWEQRMQAMEILRL